MKGEQLFGYDEYNMSLEECAQELGCSRERVRQIQNSALEKMRRALEARGLTRTELDEEPATDGPAFFDANSPTPRLFYRR